MDDMQRRGQKRGITAGTTALLLTVIGLMGLIGIAWAAAPTLTEITGQELPKTFQAGKNYTLSLNYKDPNGDPVKKTNAKFIDESNDIGIVSTDAASISGDTSTGAIITWDVRNLAQGAHKGHFEVKGLTGTARFPQEPTEFYTFGVEALGTKLGLMGVGLVVGLVGVPLLVYLLARAMNKRGNPSSAARLGLLIGILACCVLFIYLFANVYGPLVYAILILGGLAALVLLLTRR